MRITNKEEYKSISVAEIGLSDKTQDTLRDANYDTLYKIVENYRELPHIWKLSLKGLQEVYERLNYIERSGISQLSPEKGKVESPDVPLMAFDTDGDIQNTAMDSVPQTESENSDESTDADISVSSDVPPEPNFNPDTEIGEALPDSGLLPDTEKAELLPDSGILSDSEPDVRQDTEEAEIHALLLNSGNDDASAEIEDVQVSKELLVPQEISEKSLDRPISDLHIPKRVSNALLWNRIKTIREVLALNESEIMRLSNFGPVARKLLLDEIALLCEKGEEYFIIEEEVPEDKSETRGHKETIAPSATDKPINKEPLRNPRRHIVPITGNTLEEDMTVRESGGSFEERVFAKYPLLGSKIIKSDTLEKLNKNARQYIDEVLQSPWTKLHLRAEMQITLALINHAKKWKSEENGQFWKYVTLQFGYRDENDAVARLLRAALEDSMKRNNRLFIEDSNGREFKSTTVIHALSTKKSWMALFDFLFDFYKSNLDWKVVPGDPIYGLMIKSLQNKLVGETDDEAKITISSRVYSFQEGIRKLILMRPVFTKELFEKLICRIDEMINSEHKNPKTYEEQLCEEWFREKLISIANTRRAERRTSQVSRELALDYSRIRARFILKHENTVQIILPDIRLMSGDVNTASLSIDYGNRTVFRKNMSWYGNELGKTLIGETITLPNLAAEDDRVEVRVRITCDDEVIYDSGDTLLRNYMIFLGSNEISPSQINKANYTIVVHQEDKVKAENVVVTEIDDFKISGLKAYFVELRDGYVLTVNGRLVAFDNNNNTEIRVIPPEESMTLPHVTAGQAECSLAYKDSVCSILLSDTDYLYKFILLKNGERIELSSLNIVEGSGGLALICPLVGQDDICRIQIINLEDEKLVFDSSYMLVTSAEFGFNRDFYYSADDYKDAFFYAEIDDVYEEVPFSCEDNEIRMPLRNGELHVEIPCIRIRETTGAWMNGTSPAWYVPSIPQNSFFEVTNTSNMKISFYVGDMNIGYDNKGLVTIGNVLQTIGASDNRDSVLVEMSAAGVAESQRYTLAKVCFKECFLLQPEFWYEDGKLYWNRGGTFIGKPNRRFKLELYGLGQNYSFELDEDTEYLELPEGIQIGVYRYFINVRSGGMFRTTSETIASGDCIIGDRNRLRFLNRKIVLESLTDAFQKQVGHIFITPCYIDQPEFLGIEDTSEGMCPVYQGTLYTMKPDGNRYTFAFESYFSKGGHKKMMVNPVRIIYIGKNTLCITDSDGDGLYYCRLYNRYYNTEVYSLTDRAYAKDNRDKYSTADLYSYRIERM